MTDEELPTAAIIDNNGDVRGECQEWYEGEYEQELVRRKDVEQLIQDKIEKLTNEIDEIREREDRIPLTHVAMRDELGELLEEVRADE